MLTGKIQVPSKGGDIHVTVALLVEYDFCIGCSIAMSRDFHLNVYEMLWTIEPDGNKIRLHLEENR